jgi:prolyl-tRNA synthetase
MAQAPPPKSPNAKPQDAKPSALPPKAQFSDWYNELVERAELIDKRYPVKGMDVWRPYGLAVMNLVDDRIRAEMKRTKHAEVRFPTVVPETEFQKEADQIKGFGANVYWVTKGGDNELDVKLLLRPTSETAMYPMFSLWVRSHADLPLKIYQIVSVFRYETKQTRSFIRVREIHFFEAHTAHDTWEDAERQVMEDLQIWQRLAEPFCIPYTLTRRPDWDKFPGAKYSVGADAMMPELKTLQVATMHQYGENFAKPYNIQYETADGGRNYAHQTTYGMSERLLGAIVGIHGDDKGLIWPPAIAPIQAVLIPILFKGKEAPVLEACKAAVADLEKAGIRVHFDDRDVTAGSKYYDWELKGVPLRIEIGPRDVEGKKAVLVPRDLGGKEGKAFVDATQLAKEVQGALDAVQKRLLAKAQQIIGTHQKPVKTIAEAKAAEGIAVLGWCGAEECGLRMEKETEKAILGVPVKVANGKIEEEQHAGQQCGACSKPTSTVVRIARTY